MPAWMRAMVAAASGLRREKTAENYLAMLHLASAHLIFGKLSGIAVSRPEQPTRSVTGLAG